MANKQIINVNVLADTKNFSNAMKGVNGTLKGFGVAAGVAFAAAGAGLVAFSVSAVKAASNLQETSAAVGEIFGPASEQLRAFAKEAPTLLGQTQNEFLNAAKTFGIFGKAAGLAGDDNVKFSKDLTVLASDLASFNNTSVDTAITAIGAALRGESEPIRQFGVLLDDATLKARAMEMGIYDGNGALSQQQRVLAANAEIFAQTATQQGDFARTSDGMANGIKIMAAQFDNLKLVLGDALYPVVNELIPVITELIEGLTASPEFEQFVKDLAASFGELIKIVMPLLPILFQLMTDLLPPIMDIINALWPIVMKLVEAFIPFVQAILPPLVDLIMALLPIIDVFVDVLTLILPIVVKIVEAFAPLIQEMLPGMIEAIKLLIPVVGFLGEVFTRLLKFIIEPLIEGITWLFDGLNNILGLGGSKVSSPGLSANRPKLATGGIVMPRPGGVPVTVAEGGQAEAIIPLSKLGGLGGGTNITIQGNVGWSPEDLATIISRKQRQAYALQGLNGIIGVR